MSDIELRHVTKIFGAHIEAARPLLVSGTSKEEILARTGCVAALRDVSLTIPAGELCAVLGLSGCGKSTLVRHINRLIDPTSGAVLVRGTDILSLNRAALREFRRREVSMVFQGFALLPHRNVIDNVGLGLRARGEPAATTRATATRWIETVGLRGYEQQFPAQLSGGMRQRVGLARALAVDTSVILMDEPFSALDPLIRVEMQDLLRQLHNTLRKTIVFITHDYAEAARIADRIAVMKDGEIVQTGSPAEIAQSPATDYVRRFTKAVLF
jgi:glycine betaine/proline transport system ATP-binding protein